MSEAKQLRPRLTEREVEFINYALLILEQSSDFKLGELQDLPSDLKRFARIVWFTGDRRAFKLWKPYRDYVTTELHKNRGDLIALSLNARILRRRFEDLLKGRKLHSKELLQH